MFRSRRSIARRTPRTCSATPCRCSISKLTVKGEPGAPDPADAAATIASIETCVALVETGEAAAIVTNPIAKEILYRAGFAHPGHTEFLGALAERRHGGKLHPVMLLWSPELAVVPATIHIALKDVAARLTRELLVRTGLTVAHDFRARFGLAEPRLAFTGLNPHAGEGGAMGREEIEIITPALAELKGAGIAVSGPHPADTLFHAAARKRYDVVIAMYHDQALIPVKTLAFAHAVNTTLGLPFVRTSPDHGTAFDIAGEGKADPTSLIAALRLAAAAGAPGRPERPMTGAPELPPLREVVARHGLDARKALGQNFLFDLNLTARIARAAGPLEAATIVEIGPGPGGLTRALLAEGAAKVIAIERDARCLPALAEIAAHYPGRLDVVAGDALEIDAGALVGPTRPARICANLPYNIATALLTHWLESAAWPPWFDRLTLMFQREVAERIVATPAQRAAYGRLAVLCNWRCETKILFDVSPAAFTPPPKVTSSVVELRPREKPLACEVGSLSAVTQAAFGQRRKMLRQSLKALAHGNASALLAEAGIEPTARAEEIGVEGFVALARAHRRGQPTR